MLFRSSDEDTTATAENILSDLQNPNNAVDGEVTHTQNTHEQEANVNQEGTESQDAREQVININEGLTPPQDADEQVRNVEEDIQDNDGQVSNVNDCCDGSSESKALKVENEGLRAHVMALEAKLAKLEKRASLAIAKVFRDD